MQYLVFTNKEKKNFRKLFFYDIWVLNHTVLVQSVVSLNSWKFETDASYFMLCVHGTLDFNFVISLALTVF